MGALGVVETLRIGERVEDLGVGAPAAALLQTRVVVDADPGQSMVVEPGVFRTDFLDASSVQFPANRIDAYDDTPAHGTLAWADEANHTQLGDPVEGAAFVYRVASGEKLPLHLLVGRDAYERREVITERIARETGPFREAPIATARTDGD